MPRITMIGYTTEMIATDCGNEIGYVLWPLAFPISRSSYINLLQQGKRSNNNDLRYGKTNGFQRFNLAATSFHLMSRDESFIGGFE